jgi:pyruvate dehydrogenase E2 component (dihydrolipoyllysine-residue acetyltransferase)
MPSVIHAITMPRWGMTMSEGLISAWLVDVGASIAQGQEILEIETEKIANAYEAGASGLLRRKLIEPPATASVGALLGVLADAHVSDAEIDRFIAEFNVQQRSSEKTAPMQPAARAVRIADGAINVMSVGEGPGLPVVMVHGFGGDMNSWALAQGELGVSRTVHALDLPAHGGSTIPVAPLTVESTAGSLAQALDALGIARAHFVAHSLGAAVSLLLVRDHPVRVASLSLIAPAALGPDIDAAYIEAFLSAERRPQMKQALAALFSDPDQIRREMVDDVLRFMRTDGVPAALRGLAEDAFSGGKQRLVLRDVAAASAIPVQVIWGEQDRIIPAAHSRNLPPSIPVHLIAAAGHMVHLEHANRVNALLTAFVANVEMRK